MRKALMLLSQTKSANTSNTKVGITSVPLTSPNFIPPLGGPALLEQLTSDASLMANASAKQGLADMSLLFTLLRSYKVLDRVRFSHVLHFIWC